MNDYRIEVGGAPVIYTDKKQPPYNPLRRPRVNYKSFAIALSVYCIVDILCIMPFVPAKYRLPALILWTVFYFALIGRKAAIWFVHLYQNKAKDATRLRCVYEPSCSEYMILSLEKYGLIRGLFKGGMRLLRCHPPNGGQDYP